MQRLEGQLLETRWQYVALSFDDFEERHDWRAWIDERVRDALGSARLFQPNRPVWGWDFVGRQDELTRLRSLLLVGKPVGLFGLRKVGKTSLLMRFIHERLDEARYGQPTAIPIHVDMQAVSPGERDQWGFWRRLLASTVNVLRGEASPFGSIPIPTTLTKPNSVLMLPRDELMISVARILERLITWGEANHTRVLLLIDEYERLYTDDFFPRKDGLLLLDYLRGQVQQSGGVFNIGLVGVDRSWANRPRYGGTANPMYRFLAEFSLRGLDRQELGELFNKIGRRALLDFRHDAIDAIKRETGGHPFLARRLGDLMDHDIPRHAIAAVMGGRGMGKTSFALELERRLKSLPGVECVLVRRFGQRYEEVIDTLSHHLGGVISPTLPLDTLVDVVRRREAACTILVVDEAEALLGFEGGQSLLENLRIAYEELQGRLGVIVLGGSLLKQLALGKVSPFLRTAQWMVLRGLSRAETHQLLVDPLQHEWASDAIVDTLWEQSNGHPLLLQAIMERAVDAADTLASLPSCVDEAFTTFARSDSAEKVFSIWWDNLTERGQKVYEKLVESHHSIPPDALVDTFGPRPRGQARCGRLALE